MIPKLVILTYVHHLIHIQTRSSDKNKINPSLKNNQHFYIYTITLITPMLRDGFKSTNQGEHEIHWKIFNHI